VALGKSATVNDFTTDQAVLNRRAERFQREHEIERNKSMITFPNRGAPSLIQRTASPAYTSSSYSYGMDDPEANEVRT
jgi:hypothetical protein